MTDRVNSLTDRVNSLRNHVAMRLNNVMIHPNDVQASFAMRIKREWRIVLKVSNSLKFNEI